MTPLVTIAVVALVIAVRLSMPPVPRLFALSRKWGRSTMVALYTISLAAAVLAIIVSRR